MGESMKLSIKKTSLVVLSLFIMTLPLKTEAFDLAEYQTSFNTAKDSHQAAMADLATKEAQYKVAYNARLTLEKLNRQEEKQAAIDAGDSAAENAAQSEINKLDAMRLASNACGLY